MVSPVLLGIHMFLRMIINDDLDRVKMRYRLNVQKKMDLDKAERTASLKVGKIGDLDKDSRMNQTDGHKWDKKVAKNVCGVILLCL